MYAVTKIAGFQYLVKPGEVITVPRVKGEVGSLVRFDDVLFLRTDDEVIIGRPTVANAFVVGKIVEHFRGEKVTVFKFIRRENYRRKRGHRQLLTRLEITEIGYGKNPNSGS